MIETHELPVCEEKESLVSRADGIAAPIVSAAAAFLITNVRIGGAASPFGTSLTAALSPLCGLAALIGAAASSAVSDRLWSSTAELASMAVMTLYGYIFRKRSGEKFPAAVAGIIYFICSCAVSAGSGADWIMFAAAFIRSVMCAVMTLFFKETADILKNGLYFRRQSSRLFEDQEGFRLAAPAAVYITFIAALCSRGIGILNLGRMTAGFCCCAAARKFGTKGGAAAGILSAAGFLLCEQSLARCGAMLAFAAMISGFYSVRGKYAVNIAFICSCFGITAAAGMPSGTTEFIADMGAAAVIYCLLPENLYIPRLNGIFAESTKNGIFSADRLSFAADILSEVRTDAENAAHMLMRSRENKKVSLSDAVRDRICRGICSEVTCSAACAAGSDILDGCFRAAQSLTEKNGALPVKELPMGFEGCKKKTRLAEEFSFIHRLRQNEARRDAYTRRFMENAAEQLSASCSMMTSFSEDLTSGKTVDYALSDSVRKLLEKDGLKVRSVCVSFDEDMHPFCECFIYANENFSVVCLSDITDKLSSLLGAELEKPVLLRSAGDGDRLCRIRWWGDAVYCFDCRVETDAAEGGICGDSWDTFEDGLGNFYVILSDGMGKGGRAAAESAMALSLLKRLILSGIGRESALKILNVLLGVASSDEVFATLDMLSVCCFTGKASLVKMGAAPTVVYDPLGDNGIIYEYDESAAPVGIIGKTEINEICFELDEHSRVIMATDGVSGSTAYIRTLLENEKLTCEQIAERLIAYCGERDLETDEKYLRRDDKTAAAIRLYRCHV